MFRRGFWGAMMKPPQHERTPSHNRSAEQALTSRGATGRSWSIGVSWPGRFHERRPSAVNDTASTSSRLGGATEPHTDMSAQHRRMMLACEDRPRALSGAFIPVQSADLSSWVGRLTPAVEASGNHFENERCRWRSPTTVIASDFSAACTGTSPM